NCCVDGAPCDVSWCRHLFLPASFIANTSPIDNLVYGRHNLRSPADSVSPDTIGSIPVLPNRRVRFPQLKFVIKLFIFRLWSALLNLIIFGRGGLAFVVLRSYRHEVAGSNPGRGGRILTGAKSKNARLYSAIARASLPFSSLLTLFVSTHGNDGCYDSNRICDLVRSRKTP
ncbi:uncharacterized protein, partial [Dermacentor andersoni]|uniref:uncharacterized protein n=1 Tax=Dermacentor andersoni TaxID=34620 RepID=UPI003B3B9F65